MNQEVVDKVIKKTEEKIIQEKQISLYVDSLVKKQLHQEKKKEVVRMIGAAPEASKSTNFFKALVSDSGQVSTRRVIVILIAIHFIITAFYATFNPRVFANSDIIKIILEYDFFIILVGLGIISATQFGSIYIQKFKAQALKEMNETYQEPSDIPAIEGEGQTSTDGDEINVEGDVIIQDEEPQDEEIVEEKKTTTKRIGVKKPE